MLCPLLFFKPPFSLGLHRRQGACDVGPNQWPSPQVPLWCPSACFHPPIHIFSRPLVASRNDAVIVLILFPSRVPLCIFCPSYTIYRQIFLKMAIGDCSFSCAVPDTFTYAPMYYFMIVYTAYNLIYKSFLINNYSDLYLHLFQFVFTIDFFFLFLYAIFSIFNGAT